MPLRILGVAIMLLTPAAAAGQGFVLLKGGINVERAEDNLRGTTAGGGVAAGYDMSERWTVEGEWWASGAITTPLTLHRDTLFSAAVSRRFGTGQARPELSFGITAARTVDEVSTCAAIRLTPMSAVPVPVLVSCDEPDVVERTRETFSSTSLMPLAGAAVVFDVTARVILRADVRVQPWPTAFILRPSLGVGVRF